MANAHEAARALVSRRTRVSGHCVVCGKELVGYPGKQYCSESCRRTAQRRRARGWPINQRQRAAAGEGKRYHRNAPTRSDAEPPVAVTKAQPAEVPPLVARLDATRAAIARGRVFEDSTAAIRAAREQG